jgi:hypothetical protein
MRNHHTPETLLIRRQEGEAARKRRPPPLWPSSPPAAAPRMRVPPPSPPPLVPGREKAPPLRLPGTLTAARLKVTTTLDAAELLAVSAPNGQPRVTLCIHLPDRTVTAKPLRRAQRAIRETGTDKVALVLQRAPNRRHDCRAGAVRAAEGCETKT